MGALAAVALVSAALALAGSGRARARARSPFDDDDAPPPRPRPRLPAPAREPRPAPVPALPAPKLPLHDVDFVDDSAAPRPVKRSSLTQKANAKRAIARKAKARAVKVRALKARKARDKPKALTKSQQKGAAALLARIRARKKKRAAAAKDKRPSPARARRIAAIRLFKYARKLIAAGKAHMLGTKGRPNRTVQALQRDMGGLVADGIYGPRTRARGKELFDGRTFPARTSKPKLRLKKRKLVTATKDRSAKRAAADLYDHAKLLLSRGQGGRLGTRGAPSKVVMEAQQDMGGIKADGIYGPATRKRGYQLLGRTFPVRR